MVSKSTTDSDWTRCATNAVAVAPPMTSPHISPLSQPKNLPLRSTLRRTTPTPDRDLLSRFWHGSHGQHLFIAPDKRFIAYFCA